VILGQDRAHEESGRGQGGDDHGFLHGLSFFAVTLPS
jgi:hypothetical protein